MPLNDRKLLTTGLVGSTVAAICCFTPALVLLLGALGVSAWLGWIDFVLLPALAIFVSMSGYGLYLYLRRRRERSS